VTPPWWRPATSSQMDTKQQSLRVWLTMKRMLMHQRFARRRQSLIAAAGRVQVAPLRISMQTVISRKLTQSPRMLSTLSNNVGKFLEPVKTWRMKLLPMWRNAAQTRMTSPTSTTHCTRPLSCSTTPVTRSIMSLMAQQHESTAWAQGRARRGPTPLAPS